MFAFVMEATSSLISQRIVCLKVSPRDLPAIGVRCGLAVLTIPKRRRKALSPGCGPLQVRPELRAGGRRVNSLPAFARRQQNDFAGVGASASVGALFSV